MTRYQKQQILNRITHTLTSQKYVFVGRYDSSKYSLWKTIKSQHNIYIPKNKISQIVLKQFLPKEIADHTKNIFQGPTFIIWMNDSLELSKAITQLLEVDVQIYGGFINGKSINFADTKELTLLFKSQNPYIFPSQQMSYQLYKSQQFLTGINQIFISKLNYLSISPFKAIM